jgi:hypothetical protein
MGQRKEGKDRPTHSNESPLLRYLVDDVEKSLEVKAIALAQSFENHKISVAAMHRCREQVLRRILEAATDSVPKSLEYLVYER